MNYEEMMRDMDNYPDTMTEGERSAKYFAGEKVDHQPFSIQSNEEAFANVFGYTTQQINENVEDMAAVLRMRKEQYGIGGIKVGLRLRTVGQAVGSKLFFPEIGVDSVQEFVLQSMDNWNQVISDDPYKNPLYKGMIERAKQLKDIFPDMGVSTVVAGPLTTAAAIRPIELMLRDTVKAPDRLKDLLKFCNYHSLAWADMFSKEFGKVSCWICDPVSCADILSARQYHQFSEPYLKELVDGLGETCGKKPGVHICGKTHNFWDFMLELNASGFSVDNSEDLAAANEKLGHKFLLMGNISPVDAMLNGTIDDVIDACKKALEKGSTTEKGYLLGTGCQVPIGTPRENFDAFMYAVRKYGRGARLGHKPEGLRDA